MADPASLTARLHEAGLTLVVAFTLKGISVAMTGVKHQLPIKAVRRLPPAQRDIPRFFGHAEDAREKQTTISGHLAEMRFTP